MKYFLLGEIDIKTSGGETKVSDFLISSGEQNDSRGMWLNFWTLCLVPPGVFNK